MKHDVILVINAGSSSIKFSVFHFETLERIFFGELEAIFTSAVFSVFNHEHQLILKKNIQENGYKAGLTFFFSWFETIQEKFTLKAVGHRVVHGGAQFFKPVLIDDEIFVHLAKFIPLAPLHQPHNLEVIKIISSMHPGISQVACFDTAFHRTQEHLATLFAIPRKLMEEGLVRYGFHGLSYEYIASVLPEKIDVTKNKKIIVAHLGNGASMCALYALKSLATSMGLTALDGLMMGSRCGSIDPGLILYLLQEKKQMPEQITHLLYNESGLLGVSGMSSDVRRLIESDKKTAKEAIDLFCYRATREIGALAAVLQGCDALVFTAGIGENSPIIRKKIVERLTWMGIQLDDSENNKNSEIISNKKSGVIVSVIKTNEEYMMAKHTSSVCKENNHD
jgi:acetate kinase